MKCFLCIFAGISGLEKLSSDLETLLADKRSSDVTFKVQREKFYLHRSVLGSRTPVFAAMFLHNMKEKSSGCVVVDDCEADVFRLFIRYVYTGRLEGICTDNVVDLITIADKYQLYELVKGCSSFMRTNLCVDTFFDVISIAFTLNDSSLLSRTTEFFLGQAKEIMKSEKWKTFLTEDIEQANSLILKVVSHKSSPISEPPDLNDII